MTTSMNDITVGLHCPSQLRKLFTQGENFVCNHVGSQGLSTLTDNLFLQSGREASARKLRDRSHIEDTLRLATEDPSDEFSGEEQRHPKVINVRQYEICNFSAHSYLHTQMHPGTTYTYMHTEKPTPY